MKVRFLFYIFCFFKSRECEKGEGQGTKKTDSGGAARHPIFLSLSLSPKFVFFYKDAVWWWWRRSVAKVVEGDCKRREDCWADLAGRAI